MHSTLESRSKPSGSFPARRWRGLSYPLAAWLVGMCLVDSRADAPAGPGRKTVLHLANGGYVSGALAPSERPGSLRWQPDLFVAPFDFALTAVNAVHLPVPAN